VPHSGQKAAPGGSSLRQAEQVSGAARRWPQPGQKREPCVSARHSGQTSCCARSTSKAAPWTPPTVIGVELKPMNYAFLGEVIEYVAVGTAVRATDGRPFTTNLSGQDFWTLWQHGWLPRRLVLGNCVYHVAHQSLRQSMSQMGRNAEMPIFTQALYDARELAMARMQYEGQQLGADGIVGTFVDDFQYWGEHGIEFFATGTAVSRIRPDVTPVQPGLTMPLNR
jgi:uncharacterized protein YbjQ (UPF0145 family)